MRANNNYALIVIDLINDIINANGKMASRATYLDTQSAFYSQPTTLIA